MQIRNITFENVAYAYGAVKRGYVNADGVKIVLNDNEKAELKKVTDEAFELMKKETLMAAAEHNIHVLQQQAEETLEGFMVKEINVTD